MLGRDVAADAAAKVSDVARPSEHELAKADEPAPSNQVSSGDFCDIGTIVDDWTCTVGRT